MSGGLLPVSALAQLLVVIFLLIIGSVLVSRVQLKFKLRYYGKNKPVRLRPSTPPARRGSTWEVLFDGVSCPPPALTPELLTPGSPQSLQALS